MLKNFSDQRQLKKWLGKDQITYDTYSRKFHASHTDLVGFCLVKFNSNKKLNFDIMVDDTRSQDAHYGILIGTDIKEVMEIYIMFSKKVIYLDGET